MKTTLISFALLLFVTANAFSQNYIFKMYRFENSELYNLSIKKPKGFKVIDGAIPFQVNEKNGVGTLIRIIFQSNNKECLIMHSLFLMIREHDTATRNMVYAELKSGLGLNVKDSTIDIDTAKYVKMLTGNGMADYSNADTVFITKIPLQKPYREIYTYCIGIYLLKAGHPSGMIKILLSEEGKKHEDEYIRAFFDNVRYSDVAPEYSHEKVMKMRKRLKSRFIIHGKKYLFDFQVTT